MDDSSSHSPESAAADLDHAVVRVEIDGTREEVWRAISTDEGLASWMGERSSIGEVPGDLVHFTDLVTGQPRSGHITDVDEYRRLRFTWWPDTRPGEQSDVTIELDEADGQTVVTVTETVPECRRAMSATASAAASAPTAASVSTARWAWRLALLTVATSIVCRA